MITRTQFLKMIKEVFPCYLDGSPAEEWRIEEDGEITLIGSDLQELTFVFDKNDELYDWR